MKCKRDDSERDDSGTEPEDVDDKSERGNDAEHENVGGHSAANTVPAQGLGEHENVGHHLAANTEGPASLELADATDGVVTVKSEVLGPWLEAGRHGHGVARG